VVDHAFKKEEKKMDLVAKYKAKKSK
jgi:hypothetical protein